MESDGRALVRVMSVPNSAGVAGSIMGAMGENGINTELVVQSYDLDDAGNFALVIDQKDIAHALTVLEDIKAVIDAKGISYTPDVAIISVFGPHLREKPQVPALMFSSMAAVGVNSLAISTSISSVSCVVEGQYLETAVAALNEVFEVPFKVKKRPKDY